MILFLSRSDLLVSEFSPFMLDVCEIVDSPVEAPKCVATQIEHELEAPAQNNKKQIVQFLESDSPILSGPMAVRGTAGLQ
jgi:hypothetical protein